MNTRIREHAPALRAWVRITLLAGLVLAAGSARAEAPATPAKTAGDSVKASPPAKPAPAAVKPAAVAKAPVKPAASAPAKSTAPVSAKSTAPVSVTNAPAHAATTAPAAVKPATVAPAPTTPATAPAGTEARPAAVPSGTHTKPAAGTKAPPTKAAPGTPVPPTAKAAKPTTTANATAVSKTSLVVTRPLPSADGRKTAANGVAPGGPQVTAPPAQIDEHITYQYNTLGRRDPFQSMLEGEFVGLDVGGDAPPDVGGLTVVGIVWGDADRFALCEDARGNSHILRKGDKVMNGVVEELKRDGVVVNLTVDNQSESVTIPLTRKGEKKNASR
jgi:hypothetical protein